ncbi:MAG: hypothetical protein ACLTDM_18890 [Clostridium butyricum]
MRYKIIKECVFKDKNLNIFLKDKAKIYNEFGEDSSRYSKALLNAYRNKYQEICQEIRECINIKNIIGLTPSKTTDEVYVRIFDYELKDGEKLYIKANKDEDGEYYIEI